MDFSRLTTAHKIALGGAVILLIASFLPWYSVSGFGVTVSVTGWSSGFLAWMGILLGLAAGVILALKAFGKQDVRTGGFAAEQIALALAAASVVLILLRFITETTYVTFGLFLGLIAAAVVAYGSFKAMTDAGMTVDDMKRGMSGGSGTTLPPSNPPPPGP